MYFIFIKFKLITKTRKLQSLVNLFKFYAMKGQIRILLSTYCRQFLMSLHVLN